MLAVTSLVFSCQKEVSDLSSEASLETKAAVAKDQIREFDLAGKMETYTSLVPDIDGGWAGGLLPAWYPGSGEGTLSHVGRFTTVFNQYAWQVEGVGARGEAYPLTEDAFLMLADLGIYPPDNTGTVFFDKQGNSIWSNGTYTYIFETDREDRLIVQAVLNIFGGSGKYADASGHLILNGYTDIMYTPDPAEPDTRDVFEITGHIKY